MQLDAFEVRGARTRALSEMGCLFHLATALPSFSTPDVDWDVIVTVAPTVVCKVPKGRNVKSFVEELCYLVSCWCVSLNRFA